jgi:predicted nucleic acid-binding protein
MSGKRLRVYVDTSVIGGCRDDEFQGPSTRLMRRFMTGEAIIVVSDVMIAELEGAPKEVQDLLLEIAPDNVEYVTLDDEATRLAEEYVRQGALPSRMIADAQHIAVATVARVDVLVSWNFKHIVNLGRIHRYNSVNLREGYALLEIRSPLEVLQDDSEGQEV